VNQCLEAYLRCFVHGCPSKWKDWLSLAEFWYNTCYHSSLTKSPFEVLYGHEPRHLGIDKIESCAVDDLQEWLSNRKLMTQLMQQQLVRAQQRQKYQAGKNRTERTFAVGDSVFLKLQPYIQQSVMPRANYKLSFRYFGPFTILEKIGAVAYRLQLPRSSSIHPVFHVSLLKRAVGSNHQVSPTLPPNSNQFQIPQAILQRRTIKRGDVLVPQVLIHWSSWPQSMSTWEDEMELQRQFPAAPAWGQAGSREGGDVMNQKPSAVPGSFVASEAEQDLTEEAATRWAPCDRRPNNKYFGPQWQPN